MESTSIFQRSRQSVQSSHIYAPSECVCEAMDYHYEGWPAGLLESLLSHRTYQRCITNLASLLDGWLKTRRR